MKVKVETSQDVMIEGHNPHVMGERSSSLTEITFVIARLARLSRDARLYMARLNTTARFPDKAQDTHLSSVTSSYQISHIVQVPCIPSSYGRLVWFR
jgi:hypothetical protein